MCVVKNAIADLQLQMLYASLIRAISILSSTFINLTISKTVPVTMCTMNMYSTVS